ncbi:hypothetical protein [Streptomyces turgidiscabies]|uniref:Uncharacterized protein n=1 Tax=Streptomyces turgidiscabies TaxID=85558 RepID=A0ABU0S0W9_9ACTN|nr:hypothetical protein [Streptomyces turgidiscabies]MDQ0937052.1 hypothetical protein [Streptomyces turgidiscabies]
MLRTRLLTLQRPRRHRTLRRRDVLRTGERGGGIRRGTAAEHRATCRVVVLRNTKGQGETTFSDNSTTNYVVKVTACVHFDGTPDKCGPDDRPGDGR